MTLTNGYLAIMNTVRSLDWDDMYGTAMGVAFGLAETAFVEFGEILPEFEPSPALNSESVLDDFPGALFQDMVKFGEIGLEDIESAYKVMSRYIDLLPESVKY